jgi:hypothetical protein
LIAFHLLLITVNLLSINVHSLSITVDSLSITVHLLSIPIQQAIVGSPTNSGLNVNGDQFPSLFVVYPSRTDPLQTTLDPLSRALSVSAEGVTRVVDIWRWGVTSRDKYGNVQVRCVTLT